jgi:hypothetical protein
MMRVAVALAVSAALAAPGAAATSPRAIDVTGTYDSNWGPIELRQSGHEVLGTYNFHHGRLRGTLDGNLLRYQWREDSGSGRGVFVVATNGQLIGTWGTTDDVSGGGWQLTPAGAAIAQPE